MYHFLKKKERKYGKSTLIPPLAHLISLHLPDFSIFTVQSKLLFLCTNFLSPHHPFTPQPTALWETRSGSPASYRLPIPVDTSLLASSFWLLPALSFHSSIFRMAFSTLHGWGTSINLCHCTSFNSLYTPCWKLQSDFYLYSSHWTVSSTRKETKLFCSSL